MLCPKCSTEIRPDHRFCTGCGIPTNSFCALCGFQNAPAARFCGGCGQPLTVAAADIASNLSDTGPLVDPITGLYDESQAERRQLTVMFCELVKCGTSPETRDPEILRQLLHDYERSCAQVTAEFDGFVAQYVGDEVMVYFGYPKAHENDAERAVCAALRIIETVSVLPRAIALQWRPQVGIATGLVVVGDRIAKGETWEVGVVGETPNLAARIAGVAKPGCVFISAGTRGLLGQQFEYRDAGTHAFKGFEQPAQIWEVVSQRTVESRFKAVRASFATRLVDRTNERAILMDRCSRVIAGAGQVVLIGGEPGIGKSRLARELVDSIRKEQSACLLEIQCSPLHSQSALFPLISALDHIVFTGARPEGAAEGWTRLTEFLDEHRMAPIDEALPLFASLLSIPPPAQFPMPVMTPERQRRLTMQYLFALVAQLARRKPLLLLLEDLHWADPSTLEFVSYIVERGVSDPLLALFTTRPEFTPPWTFRPHVTVIPLGRLAGPDAVALAAESVGDAELSPEAVAAVVHKTDGIPLYVQEYARAISELPQQPNGTQGTTAPIPATLHELLLARLDRLGEAKSLAQLAAMLGREFSAPVLEAVWTGSSEAFWSGLQRMIDEEVVHAHPEPTQECYVFRHALLQDAAYESVLRSTRLKLHGLIAETLEHRFADIAASQPELLAHHYTAAKATFKALSWWEKAGQRANALAAPYEAGQHFSRALGLLARLPQEANRDALELRLQLQLGMSLSTFVYTAPEAGAAFRRARDLCTLLGDSIEQFPVLLGLWSFYLVRGEIETALGLARDCLRLGQEQQRVDCLAETYSALGYALMYRGDFAESTRMLQECVRICEEHDAVDHYATQHHPLVAGQSLLVHLAWLTANRALSLNGQIDPLATAERLDRPFDRTYATCYAAELHIMRRCYAEGARYANLTLELARRYGFTLWEEAARFHYAMALNGLGRNSEAISILEAALGAWQEKGAELHRAYFLAGLAEAYRDDDRIEDALATIELAHEHAERVREHFYLAEVLRLRGEIKARLDAADVSAARSDLELARDFAARQGAGFFELRAVASLLRMDRKTGQTVALTLETLNALCEDLTARGFGDEVDVCLARELIASCCSERV